MITIVFSTTLRQWKNEGDFCLFLYLFLYLFLRALYTHRSRREERKGGNARMNREKRATEKLGGDSMEEIQTRWGALWFLFIDRGGGELGGGLREGIYVRWVWTYVRSGQTLCTCQFGSKRGEEKSRWFLTKKTFCRDIRVLHLVIDAEKAFYITYIEKKILFPRLVILQSQFSLPLSLSLT